MSPPVPDDVGHVLSALADANADTGDRSESRPPAAIVAKTRDAFQLLSAVTRFLSDGGGLTSRRAVGEAVRCGHYGYVYRGRSLLADLDRLYIALADAGTTGAPNRSSRAAEGRPRGTDHFCPGRTTAFSGGDEPSDKWHG